MPAITEHSHFTVVIPTRERCDTLEHALHTCVIQDYDDLDILVSDNFSQDRTYEVVSSYKEADSRIRYVNTGKRLSMTDNFEFAMSHIRPDGYVIYIGDDDGLLPAGIRDMNAMLAATSASVLRWDAPRYFWPTIEHSEANRLHISSLSSGSVLRDSHTAIEEVLRFQSGYASLPVMYLFAAVHYEVISRIMRESTRFFWSSSPDVYAGFAVAGAVDCFLDSRRPFTIAGSSHNSIGANNLEGASGNAGKKFLAEDNIPFHSDLVLCRSMPAVTIEAFLQTRAHLPWLGDFTFAFSALVSRMMLEAAGMSEEIYTEVKDAALQIGARHDVYEAAVQAIAAHPHRGPGGQRRPTPLKIARAIRNLANRFSGDLHQGRLHLDCSQFAVRNIYDASLLCHTLFVLSDMDLLGLSARVKSSLGSVRRDIRAARRLGSTRMSVE